ncbi:hypothetical protein GCM10023215_30150 [Pseudonocardia yuanmonensis]|uniref:Uncharacterized protein n=1 Tax=Pseudonocardia yuanmonensis TaxID=1095914 RepID=A0ABP8WKR4_9PSEU
MDGKTDGLDRVDPFRHNRPLALTDRTNDADRMSDTEAAGRELRPARTAAAARQLDAVQVSDAHCPAGQPCPEVCRTDQRLPDRNQS